MEMRRPSPSYVELCRRYRRWLTEGLDPEPGDWVVRIGHDGGAVRLVSEDSSRLAAGEVLVPRLERLLWLLAREATSFVLDHSAGEFACVAFDAEGRTLANVVATEPALAVAQALAFIRAERAAQREE
ncbi:MAG: hypothetical protein NZL87_10435 [Thermomicrobium sp.]|nr:hypothetical protein [Thermomicrobium sp.]MDW7981908.1 hypothetical protein [Thermomicrobium sp.]